jgi:hypothetical protein
VDKIRWKQKNRRQRGTGVFSVRGGRMTQVPARKEIRLTVGFLLVGGLGANGDIVIPQVLGLHLALALHEPKHHLFIYEHVTYVMH